MIILQEESFCEQYKLKLIEQLVTKHGEKYRCLIEDSISWLKLSEPKWNLESPININEFVANLIEEAKKT
jgi:hypothetical protein